MINHHVVAEAYAPNGLQYNEGFGMTIVHVRAGDVVYAQYNSGDGSVHHGWHTSFTVVRISN